MMIYCYCEGCRNHDDDDTCKLDSITISDRDMTAAGFLPQCQEYEEEDGLQRNPKRFGLIHGYSWLSSSFFLASKSS